MAIEFHRPITELLDTMPSAELTFWWGEYQREFFGADRDYFAAAIQEAAIANYAGRALAEGECLNPVDLMPFLDQGEAAGDEEDEDPEIESARIGHALNAVMGLQSQAEAERHLSTVDRCPALPPPPE